MSVAEKIKATAVKDENWLQEANERKTNEIWLEVSFKIATRILKFLRENQITQRELAEKLDFSPQYLSKILKGKENLTIETITKIQHIIGVTLIQVPDFSSKQGHEASVLQGVNLSFYIDKSSLSFGQKILMKIDNFEEVVVSEKSQYAMVA